MVLARSHPDILFLTLDTPCGQSVSDCLNLILVEGQNDHLFSGWGSVMVKTFHGCSTREELTREEFLI